MSTPMSHFIAAFLYVPTVIPGILLLFPQWKITGVRRALLVAGALTVQLIFAAVLLLSSGPSQRSIWLMGTLAPVFFVSVFFFASRVKDGRFFFTLIAACLSSSICDVCAGLIAGEYATPLWIAMKLLFTGAFLTPAAYLCRKPFEEMMRSRETNWFQMSLAPLALWLSLIIIFLTPFALYGDTLYPIPTLLLCTAAILFYTTIYYYHCSTLRQIMLTQENTVLRTQMNLMERQAQSIYAAEQRAKTFRHDIRHFIRLLRGCLSTQSMAEMDAILTRMEENLATPGKLATLSEYTGDPILDTVLTFAAEQAEHLGVDFTAELHLPDALSVDRTELAVVIFNALENAIEAISREPAHGPRWVKLCGMPRPPQFFLSVSNSFTGQVAFESDTGLPITTAPGHGYGTRSMLAFTQKYNGILEFRHDDGTFHLRLLL